MKITTALGYLETLHAILLLEYHDQNFLSISLVKSPKQMNEKQRELLSMAIDELKGK